MNTFSCSFSFTRKAIIDCLFNAFDSFSWGISLEYIAKLEVAWLETYGEELSCQSVAPTIPTSSFCE